MSWLPAPAGPIRFVRRLAHEWTHDRIPDQAAIVAFYSILSLFPALLALAALLGALDSVVGAEVASRVEDQVLDALRTVLTDEASGTLDAIQSLFEDTSPGLLTFSLILAVWTMTRGFAALVRALDTAYDLDDHRPWLRTRATALVLAVGSLVAAAVMLTLLVVGPLLGSGEDLADRFGLGGAFVFAWDALRLPVAFVVLVLWAATIFHIAPDHHTPWRADLPGALVTAVLWIVFSGGLRVYLAIASAGNAVFGALGGVLIVLLWFWLLSLAVLLGGEINQLLIDPEAGSAAIEGGAERGHEGASFDGGAAVEDDPHDCRGDHDTV
ncbi:YihY/virulence factor BrkB family protein [Actinospongicola halichondriae]|uniref:YihY/virulence factor BrkB family protein n=1 Tax=Actinospongicola halichondriae TaxID=3236844 RepID=UPI003D4A17BE